MAFRTIASRIAAKRGIDIVEIPFPEHLRHGYQEYTCADMSKTNNTLEKYGKMFD